ncbi:MAG: helix-turn-helix transcriptional regulator [Verrucomicrobia bacterium]|nr:helix-turn-helix transcriptional regulator [Verrucomicrobiota bacterium]MBV8274934.1 helix-turn-helix transcriptional regulator [Verrucomicrobiota bacterium]
MTLDYGSAVFGRDLLAPPSLLGCIGLRNGQVKQLNFRARLFDLQRSADAVPLHRPKQHVVCLHHFDRPMKLERNLDGRHRRETTAKGDIAFLPADAPTLLRPGKDDPQRVISYSYLVIEPSYLAELALSNGISGPLDFIPTFATPDPLLHEIADALTSALRVRDPAASLFTESLLNTACARILHAYAQVRYRLSGPPRLTDYQLRRAIDYIHDHIAQTLDLGSISQAVGLSAFHFARLFKAATGDSPFRFVTRTRMQRAKELLRKTRLPISEIAERVGYRKPSHFSARFRAISRCSPDAYRKSARG